MSRIMLHGILNMPTSTWQNDFFDKSQRYNAYVEASKIIQQQDQQIKLLNEKCNALERNIKKSTILIT